MILWALAALSAVALLWAAWRVACVLRFACAMVALVEKRDMSQGL